MNQNPLFIDEHYASTQPLGRRPVLDSLIFSLTVGMSVSDTSGKTIANLGYETVVFERPMFAGDSLYAESEVLEKRESASKPDRGIVAIETRGYNQNKERVIVLRRRYLTPKKGTDLRPGIYPPRFSIARAILCWIISRSRFAARARNRPRPCSAWCNELAPTAVRP
jgi:acyl dehydratase